MVSPLLQRLAGGLIVSCQPVDDGPLDNIPAIVGFARAAEAGGASALRIEGVDNVAAVVAACTIPVIGITKRDLPASPVRITPFMDDVAALAAAGAAIIAVDATGRARPIAVSELLGAIRAAGCLAMADASSIDEARAAHALGFDVLGTTMSGYAGGNTPPGPDLEFVAACKAIGGFVVAEGRYNDPAAAASAIRAGANAVCVGSAITRTEHVTAWFRTAVRAAKRDLSEPVLALDIGGTKTLAAMVIGGTIVERHLLPTPADIATPQWFAGLSELAARFETQPTRVAAAVTGVVEDGLWSPLNREIIRLPESTPLQETLERQFNVPVVVFNDAQAAAWGEYRFGAGRNCDMAFLTISSGIGGGLVLDGRLQRGRGGLAGSLGQQRGVPAGARLESQASGFGMAAAAARLGRHEDARAIVAAAEAGASWAEAIVADAVVRIVDACADLQLLVDPDCVVIGGGVGMASGFVARLIAQAAGFEPRLRPAFVPAVLGADAGVLGVADLALL